MERPSRSATGLATKSHHTSRPCSMPSVFAMAVLSDRLQQAAHRQEGGVVHVLRQQGDRASRRLEQLGTATEVGISCTPQAQHTLAADRPTQAPRAHSPAAPALAGPCRLLPTFIMAAMPPERISSKIGFSSGSSLRMGGAAAAAAVEHLRQAAAGYLAQECRNCYSTSSAS